MSKKRKILENPVVVGILELVIFVVGALLAQIIISLFTDVIFKSLEEGVFKEFINTFIELVSFIITIIICMLFMRITNRESLKIFTQGKVSDRLRTLGIGLLIGLGANFIISLIAVLTGSVEVSFNGFSPYILLIIPGVFIQCSTEEVLCRGFVASFLKERGHIAIIVVGGLCFILHHVGNMVMFGMSITFCINVFLIGAVMYLMIVVSGNFWIAAGFHTAWNYTQQFLFGLPNSGRSSSFALYNGADAHSTFFYDSIYGNEGSLITTILLVIGLAVLIYLYSRKNKKQTA